MRKDNSDRCRRPGNPGVDGGGRARPERRGPRTGRWGETPLEMPEADPSVTCQGLIGQRYAKWMKKANVFPPPAAISPVHVRMNSVPGLSGYRARALVAPPRDRPHDDICQL